VLPRCTFTRPSTCWQDRAASYCFIKVVRPSIQYLHKVPSSTRMAVAQLVSLFEGLDHGASIKPMSSSFRTQSSSSRVRLSLQTIFSHNPLHRSPKPSKNMSATPSSFLSSSPSSSFSSFRSKSGAGHDIENTLSPMTASPRGAIRRQPSAIDLALEEEQTADHAESIGLGLLEPRPRANTTSSMSSQGSGSQCSMMEFMTETMQTPVILDGIFEVMERA
jgi:hypothetical protein